MSEQGMRTNYYLCDYCAEKLDGDHLNTCVCIPTFPHEHRKKTTDGRRDPLSVCKHYETEGK